MGNKLICLLGGAAVGKDTIRNKLLEKHEDLIEATSHTTRPMRATENGSEYYFIQEEEFHAMYENGEFLETRTYEIEVPDTDEKVLWYYGYSLEEISKKLQQRDFGRLLHRQRVQRNLSKRLHWNLHRC